MKNTPIFTTDTIFDIDKDDLFSSDNPVNFAIYEDIEKHDSLNQKLFDDSDHLKPEVSTKILNIVNEFVEELEADGIDIIIDDIVLIGSNASYNYTKNSDLDIHVIANTAELSCSAEMYDALYSAYRSIFNKKFDIDFYGIPVELYVETENIPTVSNGIYSVKKDEWIKEPDLDAIPDVNIDKDKFNSQFNDWKQRVTEIKLDFEKDRKTPDEISDEIFKFLEDIYNLRKTSLKNEGEYGLGNLVFKEIRNQGMLDKVKELKDQAKARSLSLENLKEALNIVDSDRIKSQLGQIAHCPAIIQQNGYFIINNLKEADTNRILSQVKMLPYVEQAWLIPGRFDISHSPILSGIPKRIYTLKGKIYN